MNLPMQISELAIVYGVTAAAMFASLVLKRADTRAYWRLPAYSAMALALGVMLWNLSRKHLLPEDWVNTHPGVVFYGALALYALLGFALGLLLARLTRR